MNPILLIFGVLGALLGIIVYALRSSPLLPVDAGECRVSESEFDSFPECFFSSGYLEASARFKDSAKRAGAEVSEMMVTDKLSTQVAVLRGDPHRFLVHISGTHGVEAYAGSAVQLAALRSLATSNESSRPTMVFVHALNPFGFHHGRRVNEDNVDLNRNFLSDDEFAFVRSRHPNYAHYEDFDDFLNPTSKPTGILWLDELLSVFNLLSVFAKHDFGSIKKAMVSGNYHKQNGYGFGGFQRTASANNVISLLTQHLRIPELAQQLVLVDVHTGLGPQGVDTLMFNHDDDLEGVFPTEMDGNGKAVGALKANSFARPNTNKAANNDKGRKDAEAVAAGYELTVGTTESLCRNFVAPSLTQDKRFCITQEFGTVPTIVVGKSSIDENYAHYWGTDREKAHYKQQYRPCFYVESKSWKRSVVHRGTAVVQQAIQHLMK